jgi:hypothetical protein
MSGRHIAVVKCQGPRGHVYYLPPDGVVSFVEGADADTLLVTLSRGSSPVLIVGTVAEFDAALGAAREKNASTP